jgi:PAS domain S-box-containing protein
MLNIELDLPLLSTIHDSISIGVLGLDSQGVIRHHNAAALHLLNLSGEGTIGRSIFDLHWRVDRFNGRILPANSGDSALRLILSPPCSGIVLHIPRADGKNRYIAISSDKPNSTSGALINIVTLCDVTAIMAARDFSEKIVRTSPIIKIATDSSGLITLFNPAAEAAFECSARDVIGKHSASVFFDLFHDINSPEKSEISEMIGGAKVAGDYGRNLDRVIRTEMTCVKKNGARFIVDLSAVTLNDSEGQGYGFLYNAIDITERKLAEKKILKTLSDLERSNSELESFAYIASHDLQAPLRHISSYVDLLNQRLAGNIDEDVTKWMKYIVNGAESMKSLIDGLLAFARVRANGSEHLQEPVNLEAVVSKVRKYFSSVYPDVDFQIGSLPTLNANTAQLEQLFQNLLQNAIKFRQPGVTPKVIVTASDHGSEYCLKVQDNGIGIDKNNFNRIFGLFQRLHTKEKFPGSGIGLAICKKIVSTHGGKIWIESELGMGATFCFTLVKDIGASTDIPNIERLSSAHKMSPSNGREKP